ncbi:hypothetical protein DU508_21635 [Pedobacter chinensis]|uniref:Uncharacterized protein n=1 Tax=Pedobacter chinensis TaxID=2282421 RepID=A0A369PUK9_9SPHI|nr:hypothetical protein [Pedobacter chinensis]RDC54326.1 hypothetical protein DU508_21635 [Pedobacter chinensis]
MTWTTFGLWISLAYLAYYGLNLAFDLLISGRSSPAVPEQEELFFEESSEPELISYLQDSPVDEIPAIGNAMALPGTVVLSSGQIQATGAVSIAELLIRAKDELIQHTREIPY